VEWLKARRGWEAPEHDEKPAGVEYFVRNGRIWVTDGVNVSEAGGDELDWVHSNGHTIERNSRIQVVDTAASVIPDQRWQALMAWVDQTAPRPDRGRSR
jgi:hypothetical protein